MDKVLKGEVFPPNAPAYDVVHQLTQLKADVEENIRKSKHRQLRSYNKKNTVVWASNQSKEYG